jgi:hypothetical protein
MIADSAMAANFLMNPLDVTLRSADSVMSQGDLYIRPKEILGFLDKKGATTIQIEF